MELHREDTENHGGSVKFGVSWLYLCVIKTVISLFAVNSLVRIIFYFDSDITQSYTENHGLCETLWFSRLPPCNIKVAQGLLPQSLKIIPAVNARLCVISGLHGNVHIFNILQLG